MAISAASGGGQLPYIPKDLASVQHMSTVPKKGWLDDYDWKDFAKIGGLTAAGLVAPFAASGLLGYMGAGKALAGIGGALTGAILPQLTGSRAAAVGGLVGNTLNPYVMEKTWEHKRADPLALKDQTEALWKEQFKDTNKGKGLIESLAVNEEGQPATVWKDGKLEGYLPDDPSGRKIVFEPGEWGTNKTGYKNFFQAHYKDDKTALPEKLLASVRHHFVKTAPELFGHVREARDEFKGFGEYTDPLYKYVTGLLG